ncbi:MAG: FAD-binding oxidoreductase [Spirochaetaceae bacterium]|nr:FAD-binding oxidoreductase [Spirochaetaceae bacterium]
MRVIVVGAGVVGLTCAVRLAEAGHDTAVLARDLPPETTSAVAAALWYPYRAAPREAVTRWSRTAYDEFSRLATQCPEAGVRVVPGVELLPGAAGSPAPPLPWWQAAVPALTPVRDPRPGFAHGWRLDLPIADTSVYLGWLAGRLADAGGTVTRAWLPELPTTGVVVNCTGLAARALTGDVDLHPVRGQVVMVARPAADQVDRDDEWLLDQSDPQRPFYVVPRQHDVVIGGTAEDGVWDTHPDPATAAALLERAGALVPALRDAPVTGHRAGLRPARSEVRLESVAHPDGSPGGVVHCYGHGGAGVTLSWGCAQDVLEMVESLR